MPSRQLIRAAAVSAAALTGALSAAGVLATEAFVSRNRIGKFPAAAPYTDGRYGPHTRGTSIRIAFLGDSLAAGIGVTDSHATCASIMGQLVSDEYSRAVVLQNHATPGACSDMLAQQVERALWTVPHVAVIIIGANDLTHLRPWTLAARELGSAVKALRDAGSQVVVGTCPDVGTVRLVPQPLRTIAHSSARRFAHVQARVVVANGGIVVDLGELLAQQFNSDPEHMFSQDRYHPSAIGYLLSAQALAPAVLAALEVVVGPRPI